MIHTCHAIECSAHVKPAMFMCKRHWYMLPKPMRDQIWFTYKPWQERTWEITNEYADAAQAALREIAEKEGRHLSGDEEELTLYDHFRPQELPE